MARDFTATLPCDEWGRLVADYDAAMELLLCGYDVAAFEIKGGAGIDAYNASCRAFDKPEEALATTSRLAVDPTTYHAQRASEWLTKIDNTTLWDELFARCKSDVEQDRFLEELREFDQRGMLPVLAQLKVLIDRIDEAKVVRGVGRGSSVASFVLYVMGVHFINPLTYNLPLSEFLK